MLRARAAFSHQLAHNQSLPPQSRACTSATMQQRTCQSSGRPLSNLPPNCARHLWNELSWSSRIARLTQSAAVPAVRGARF